MGEVNLDDMPPLQMAGDLPAYCGRCGYDLRGITTRRCPECGGNLRSVGVLRTKPRGRNVFARCIAFALVYVPIAAILSAVLSTVVPTQVTRTVTLQHARVFGDRLVGVTTDLTFEGTDWPLGGEFDPAASSDIRVATRGPTAAESERNKIRFSTGTNDIAGTTAGTTAVEAEAGTIDSLAAALQQACDATDAVVPADAVRELATELAASQDRHENELQNEAGRGGWWGSSSSGSWGSTVSEGDGAWRGDESSENTNSTRSPLWHLVPTLFFAGGFLLGLVMIAAGIDPRPAAWRRRTMMSGA